MIVALRMLHQFFFGAAAVCFFAAAMPAFGMMPFDLGTCDSGFCNSCTRVLLSCSGNCNTTWQKCVGCTGDCELAGLNCLCESVEDP